MLGRALDSGVPLGQFTGDEVYGSDRNLRLWLEREEIPLSEPDRGHWLLARAALPNLRSWPATFASVRRAPPGRIGEGGRDPSGHREML